MSFDSHAGALQGLKKILLKQLNSSEVEQDGFLLDAPQLLGWEEQGVTSSLPGANATADENTKIQSLLVTLRWGKLHLRKLAAMIGAEYSLTGVAPNQKHRLIRRTSDIAPNFSVEGLVDYIGSDFPTGDYHFYGAKGKVTGPPKMQHETGEPYATVELQMKFLETAAGDFYQMEMNETQVDLEETADNTPPSVSGVVPGDGASAVAANANVVFTFSEKIHFDPANFSLLDITSPSAITDVNFDASINGDGTQVTLNPVGNFTASSVINARAAGVEDMAGNVMSAPSNTQFTVAS